MLDLDWRSSHIAAGASYGFHVHSERLKEACLKLGARIDSDAEITVWVGPPEDFSPIIGKYNVLFTAWEHDTIPQRLADPAKAADLIVVPAQFLKPVFEQATGRTVAVVHLGVDLPPFDPLRLNRPKRRKRGRPFTWLWCGQAGRRKGWDLLPEIWRVYTWIGTRRSGFSPSRLHVKTTAQDGSAGALETAPGNHPYPVIYDTRNLSRADYWRLLRDADAFLYPSRGEGFGLTLAEALAAGLPAVYPPTTAMPDYAEGFACETERGWTESPRWGRLECQTPSIPSTVKRMVEVVLDHRRACAVGRRAARRMKAFTWSAAAVSFLSVVRAMKEA